MGASALLCRISTRFRSANGNIRSFSRSAFVASDTGVGWEGLTYSLHSNGAQRCSVGLRSGLCGGQSSSFTPNSFIHNHPCLYGTCFCALLEQEEAIPKLLQKSWEFEILNYTSKWQHCLKEESQSTFLLLFFIFPQFGPQRDFTLFKSLLTLSSVAQVDLWHQREETLAHFWHLQIIF